VPLQTLTSLAPQPPRIARAATLAACVTAAAFTIATADAQTAPPDCSMAEPSQPTVSRYDDVEGNKANSMRALGLAKMRDALPSPYEDLEANKARSQQAR
jgi:hypothetical protein